MDYYNELLQCIENVGIITTDQQLSDNILEVIQIDSWTFIALIVEIENHFQIEFPEEYLTYQTIATLIGFSNLIKTLCEEGMDESCEEGAF